MWRQNEIRAAVVYAVVLDPLPELELALDLLDDLLVAAVRPAASASLQAAHVEKNEDVAITVVVVAHETHGPN